MNTSCRPRSARVWATAVLALFAVATPATGQSPAPAPAAQAPADTPVSEADFARIRRAVNSQPAVNLDERQIAFYVEILAKQPRFAEFVKGYDFVNGPTRRGNPMTHQEYLNMVTPKMMQSSVGITALETLQFAMTNWLGQALIKKALEDVKQARSEQELQAIRDRINRELDAITGAVDSPR